MIIIENPENSLKRYMNIYIYKIFIYIKIYGPVISALTKEKPYLSRKQAGVGGCSVIAYERRKLTRRQY